MWSGSIAIWEAYVDRDTPRTRFELSDTSPSREPRRPVYDTLSNPNETSHMELVRHAGARRASLAQANDLAREAPDQDADRDGSPPCARQFQ